MKILLVDDSEDIRFLIQMTLRAGGYEDVITATSAMEAYSILGMEGGQPPHVAGGIDLILMDIIMPEINGIEACKRIKERKEYRETPIIMVTAKKDTKDLEAAFDAGANDYIIKPINRIELMARIRSAMRLKEETDRRKAHERELEEKNRELEKALKEIEEFNRTPFSPDE